MLNKGFTLDRLGHSEDAITVYNELIQRFGSSDEPRLQEQVAKAFLNKGVNLGQRNLLEDEITIYDELIQHFGTSNMPALEEPVTKAMVNKGVRLGQLGRSKTQSRYMTR
ncbi:hypothetical protein H2136_13010 [Aeromonas hydrophila]|uniref:Tetratricopeptide repeat protein n=1 Tax=Aeromonas hydrophila TaxID=644 RepID=A0A926FKA2_AERHY|nr:hypothetical protein [Aeromonas hydrophila]